MEFLLIPLLAYGLILVLGYVLGIAFWFLVAIVWLIVWAFKRFNTQPKTTKKSHLPKLQQVTAISVKYTAKEKIEFITGLVGISYTLAMIGLAIFTSLPNDVIFVSWLMLCAITSHIANKKLNHIPNQHS